MVPRNDGPKALYPVNFELQYRVFFRDRELASVGIGHTVALGSRMLVFSSNGDMPRGDRIKVFVNWPVLLDSRIKLQLVLEGQVVEYNANQVTLKVEKYEFRTRGVALETQRRPTAPAFPRSARAKVVAMHA